MYADKLLLTNIKIEVQIVLSAKYRHYQALFFDQIKIIK